MVVSFIGGRKWTNILVNIECDLKILKQDYINVTLGHVYHYAFIMDYFVILIENVAVN